MAIIIIELRLMIYLRALRLHRHLANYKVAHTRTPASEKVQRLTLSENYMTNTHERIEWKNDFDFYRSCRYLFSSTCHMHSTLKQEEISVKQTLTTRVFLIRLFSSNATWMRFDLSKMHFFRFHCTANGDWWIPVTCLAVARSPKRKLFCTKEAKISPSTPLQ